MPKLLLIFIFFLYSNISLASDDKPGRFFEDQPDVKGTKYEQETFFVKDPNENILEIKTLTSNPE